MMFGCSKKKKHMYQTRFFSGDLSKYMDLCHGKFMETTLTLENRTYMYIYPSFQIIFLVTTFIYVCCVCLKETSQ